MIDCKHVCKYNRIMIHGASHCSGFLNTPLMKCFSPGEILSGYIKTQIHVNILKVSNEKCI